MHLLFPGPPFFRLAERTKVLYSVPSLLRTAGDRGQQVFGSQQTALLLLRCSLIKVALSLPADVPEN